MDHVVNFVQKTVEKVSKKRLIELASMLIKIPSETGSEKAVANVAFELFRQQGIEVEKFDRSIEKNRPNVVAFVNREGAPLLTFNGHLDHVRIAEPTGWKTNPFKPTVKWGKLIGRGAIDMKGACAAIIHTMEILNKLNNQERFSGAVRADLTVAEEGDTRFGIEYLAELMKLETLKVPNYCINAEQSNLRIRNVEKGGVLFEIKFRGKPTHTAWSRVEGVNAIKKAAKAIMALNKQPDKYHPLAGHPVFSINRIHAESSMSGNQVPGECTIFIDYRSIPGETEKTVLDDFKQKLDKIAQNDPDFEYTFDNTYHIPPITTSSESEIVGTVKKVTKSLSGKEAELFTGNFGGSEMRCYYDLGAQTIGFGPIGGHPHGPNEYVEVESLICATKVYLATALQLAKKR